MTSLIAWIGVDERGPSSAYFASDSRITWPGALTWDHGRKLFACSRYPHILAYCGDVLFPTQTLGQITEMIDSDLLFGPHDNIDGCTERIVSLMSRAFEAYPPFAKNAFDVLHCMRQGDSVPSQFHLRRIAFDSAARPNVSDIDMPDRSQVVAILGSGTTSVKAHLKKWQASDVGGTSRSAFSAFCDSLAAGDDPKSEGPPQLVGLWRRAAAKTFGIIWQRRRYFYGTEVDAPMASEIRWYNNLFEICDPNTLVRRPDAQRQPRPKGLLERDVSG